MRSTMPLLIGLGLLAASAESALAFDCSRRFEVDAPAVVDGPTRRPRATLTATDGRCRFAVRLCVESGFCPPPFEQFHPRDVTPPPTEGEMVCGPWETHEVLVRGRTGRKRLQTEPVVDYSRWFDFERARVFLVCRRDEASVRPAKLRR